VAIPHWLREEFALEGPYQTLHGSVRYQLKATLKRARPSHAKKRRGRGGLCQAVLPPPWDSRDLRPADPGAARAGVVPGRKPLGLAPPGAPPSDGLWGEALPDRRAPR
jgi:hypothetical protein